MFAAVGLAVVVAGCGLLGCATAPEPRGSSLAPVAETEVKLPDAPPSPPTTPTCQARIGTDRLRRSSVKRTVDAGLGRWLQTVSIDPLLARGRFKGWIIRSLDQRDSCYAGVDLRAGDVVTRVNGRGVEHPEDAMEVWSALPASPELVIDFMRDGQPRTMRFGIVDQ